MVIVYITTWRPWSAILKWFKTVKVFFDIAKKVARKVASKLTGKVAKDIATKAAKAIEEVQKMLEAKQASYSERSAWSFLWI